MENLIQTYGRISTEIETNYGYINQANENIESNLGQINQILLETGGIENLRQLLDQYTTVQTLLDRNRQEAIAVRSLDAYLMEFRKPRNHRELRKFLWNELGFVGLIIYFLRLITSRK